MLQIWSRLSRILLDDRAVETLEWILVGALVTVIALAVYTTTLSTPLSTAVGKIGEAVAGP